MPRRVVSVTENHAIVTSVSAFAQFGDCKDLTLTEISRLTSGGDSYLTEHILDSENLKSKTEIMHSVKIY